MLDRVSLLMKETKGATIFDNCILIFFKVIYLGSRIPILIIYGKNRRDRLDIWNFGRFLYKAIKFLGGGNPKLLKVYVPKYDYKFYCGINNEDYVIMSRHEDEIIDRFSPKQGDIVVDIGAHMGRYTIISSKRVGPHGKVIAIEAEPFNFEILNRNIKLNQLSNVVALNDAVYSKETKIKLYLTAGESGYTIFNTTISNRVKTGQKFVDVNANTLDNLLQQNGITGEVNWIKIDVEGAEFEVLKGAHNVLSKSKCLVLLIEVHGDPNIVKPKVEEFLSLYKFKVELEKIYWTGSMHILARKSASLTT